jgi:low affinity IgE Fc receptor
MSSTPRSWHDALHSCRSAGQTLVQIESPAEDDFVASLSGASLWLGASDTQRDGHFIWSDGSPIGFSHWGAAQPDDYAGPDCVEKRQEPNELWYDQPCADAKLYVCERALAGSPARPHTR